ncbi:MAG TPA: hypothetical protein VGP93_08955 [Polyangiaceae bacterium]|nr:hypothetical protein [Polyangiaceae bacterium]
MAIACLGLLLASACATYREDLNRGQRLYEENQYEHSLAIWRLLEQDVDSLSLNDQARYAYLRGMTDYRLRFRADARHWLGLARAIEQEHSGGLSVEWKERLKVTLDDLNKDVYGGAENYKEGESSFTEHTTEAPTDAPRETPTEPPLPEPQP